MRQPRRNGKFLDSYSFPRMIQEETESLSRLITSKEIESVIKNCPKNKNSGPHSFTGEFY